MQNKNIKDNYIVIYVLDRRVKGEERWEMTGFQPALEW